MTNPIVISLHLPGVASTGTFLLGIDGEGWNVPVACAVEEIVAQFGTPLNSLMSLQVRNLTKDTNSVFYFTGDGVKPYLEATGSPLDFEEGDELSVYLDSLHDPEESGADINFLVTIK